MKKDTILKPETPDQLQVESGSNPPPYSAFREAWADHCGVEPDNGSEATGEVPRLVRCPVCGGEAERPACGPFMSGDGHAKWLNVVRCKNHCTRGAIKESWEDAERDWNDRFRRTPKSSHRLSEARPRIATNQNETRNH